MLRKGKKSSRIRNRRILGFTLIELLIVIGIVSILLGVSLVAINPVEQSNKARDLTTKAVAEDFIQANVQFLTAKKNTPWKNNPDCMVELNTGGSLGDMEECVGELIADGMLENKYVEKSEVKDIQVVKCGDTAVVCYNPRSKQENLDPQTRFSKFGVNTPGCPSANNVSTECYWCKPVIASNSCNIQPTPTPTAPVASIEPTIMPSITPSPTPFNSPYNYLNIVPGYDIDQTKLFRNYALFAFYLPEFSIPVAEDQSYWVDVSVRSDFGGDYKETNLGVAWTDDYYINGTFAGALAYQKITKRAVALLSLASNYELYRNNCGKTLYWRVASGPMNDRNRIIAPDVYRNIIDCETKVNPRTSSVQITYGVYGPYGFPYKIEDDYDKNGVVDYVDWWLEIFSTKTRAGGWQGPE